MTTGSVPAHGRQLRAEWTGQWKQWRRELGRSLRSPASDSVHDLRVLTLRLRTEVDLRMRDGVAAERADEAARRWSRLSERLRKALGPVRNADVRLETLREIEETAGEQDPGLRREIGVFRARLKRDRASAAGRLVREIERRSRRLGEVSRRLEGELRGSPPPGSGPASRSRALRELITGLSADLPGLGAPTLHDLRKRARIGRYLAESLAEGDPRAARAAGMLRRMQGAIGRWHDGDSLARRARRTLGEESRLASLLEGEARRSLRAALRICRDLAPELNAVYPETGP